MRFVPITAREWALAKELAQTKLLLAQAHQAMAVSRMNAALVEDAALGEAFVAVEPKTAKPAETIDYGALPQQGVEQGVVSPGKADVLPFSKYHPKQCDDCVMRGPTARCINCPKTAQG